MAKAKTNTNVDRRIMLSLIAGRDYRADRCRYGADGRCRSHFRGDREAVMRFLAAPRLMAGRNRAEELRELGQKKEQKQPTLKIKLGQIGIKQASTKNRKNSKTVPVFCSCVMMPA